MGQFGIGDLGFEEAWSMEKYSWQLAGNKSLTFGVIRSLRSAVICCNRYR